MPKLDFFIKHSSLNKCNNSTRFEVKENRKGKEICAICCNLASAQARMCNDEFENFKVFFQFLKVDNCPLKHWSNSTSWTMVEAMHNILFQTIKIVVQKATYILVSCDKVTTIDNQNWLNVHVYDPYINGVYCMVHRTNLVVQTLGGLNLVTKIESLLSSTYNYFVHSLK
jgi:hypothetical protein